MPGRVRVFVACSLDGFLAGPDGDLSWLPQPDPDDTQEDQDDAGYAAFREEVGALLLGRATVDAVLGFGVPWPYGDTPVLVATTRPLDPPTPTVRAVAGTIDTLLDEALAAAGGKDVWVDGGTLIRQALDAGRVDHLIVSVVPVVLGAGAPLFAGVETRRAFTLESQRTVMGGLVQLALAPAERSAGA